VRVHFLDSNSVRERLAHGAISSPLCARNIRIGAILVCVFLECNCVRYNARPLNPQVLENQFRSRSLADPGLCDFVRRQSGNQRLGWPPAALDLNALTYVAFYFSPEIGVAQAQLRSAEAAVLSARQRINPSLAAEGGYNRTPESTSTYGASTTFTIETAGKRGYRILEAEKLAEAARIALHETTWRIRRNVRSAFADYYFASHRLKLLRSENAVQSETVGILERRLKLGDASHPDVFAVRAQQAETAVNLRGSETEVAQTLAALAGALGLPVTALENARFDTASLEHPPLPQSLPLLRVQQAGLLHRADIRRMLAEYGAADARLRLEIANQYPDISLTPAYSFQEGFPAYTLGSAIDSLPIFHHRQGQIAEAEAARTEMKARFIAFQAQAIGETESAVRQYRGAVQQWLEAQNHLANVQRQRESAVLAAFKLGEADRMEVALARSFTLAADQTRMDTLLRVQHALGALENAVQAPLEAGLNPSQIPFRDSASEALK
jgi:outer membrane protein, heavy metal efflux system